MDRNNGSVMTVGVVLAAVLGLTALPTRKSTPTTSREEQINTPAATLAHNVAYLSDLKPACSEIEQRILPFLPPNVKFAPEACFSDQQKFHQWTSSAQSLPPGFEFLIATVPDPVHTHLALQFDRLLDSVRLAAQDEGFLYDSSWFPWVDQPHEYSSLSDQDKAIERRQFRESQPGIMVFRNSALASQHGESQSVPCANGDCARVLLVFVVGENPSHGINEQQFANAIGWISAMRSNGTGKAFHILGPAFSGSFSSLARLLSVSPGPKQVNVQKYLATNCESIAKKGWKTAEGEAVDCKSRTSPAQAASHPDPRLENDPRAAALLIFSGTATSQSEISRFSDFLGGPNQLGPSRFVSFQQSDEVAINRYCAMVRKDDYGVVRLAIISEDGTAYGRLEAKTGTGSPASNPLINCFDGNPKGPLLLYYPREISSLRSSYARSFSENNPQSIPLGTPALSQAIAETDNQDRDAARTYGGNQTIQSNDATLLEIVSALKRNRIRFILLRSSNVLDQIFLTSYFTSRYPDGRIVLLNSDLLFQSITGAKGIRGTTSISTYPQITGRKDWSLQYGDRNHLAFADSNSEGTYLAGRFLLHLDNAPADNMSLCPWMDTCCGISPPSTSGFLYQQYGVPWWLQNKQSSCLPTWLSVLGTRQVWPVAVLDEPPVGSSSCGSRERSVPQNSSAQFKNSGGTQYNPLPMPFSIQFCSGLLLLACCWHVFCCWSATPLGAPRCRTYFVPVPGFPHAILVFLGCLLFVLLAIVFATFTRTAGESPFSSWQPKFVNTVYWGMLVLSLLAMTGNRLFARTFPSPSGTDTNRDTGNLPNQTAAANSKLQVKPREFPAGHVRAWSRYWHQIAIVFDKSARWIEADRTRRILFGVLVLGVSATILEKVFKALACAWFTPQTEAFIVWRSVHIFSGVSPLTPFLLLVVGSYGWIWCSLAGLALFNRDCPKLPDSPEFREPIFSHGEIGISIERLAKPLELYYALLLVPGLLLGFLTAFFSSTWSRGFLVGSLGPAGYGKLFAVWLCLCIAVILADAIQMLRLWSKLRSLLFGLDVIPLRRALYSLEGFSWGNVWKMSGSVFDRRYRLLCRQTEAFSHFKSDFCQNGLPEVNKDSVLQVDKDPILRAALCDRLDGLEAAQSKLGGWYLEVRHRWVVSEVEQLGDIQDELAKTSAFIFGRILRPSWKRETGSLIQIPSTSYAAGKAQSTGSEGITTEASRILRNAEEFVALVFLGFIQNVLGRIRTIALGMFWLFMMAALSVVSYPFDPRPVLGGTLLSVFAVSGIIVVLVYAGMHRNATLSHITKTTPGQLGWAFWMKLVAIGIGPLLAALSAFFPDISGSAVSWLQPGADALR